MQLTHCYQVLTGVLPYDRMGNYDAVASRIRSGGRPLRPRNQDVNRWLRRRVWDMITTCWNKDPAKRWEVPAIRVLFSTLGPQEVLDVEAGRQRRGGFIPRITSLFQFLQVPEPEIERIVNEMDRVGSSTSPTLPPRLTRAIAIGRSRPIGSRTTEDVQ